MTAHRRGRPAADRSGLVRLCGRWLPARLAAAVRERAAALSRPLADVLAACVVVVLGAGPAIEVHATKQVAVAATSKEENATHEEEDAAVPTQERGLETVVDLPTWQQVGPEERGREPLATGDVDCRPGPAPGLPVVSRPPVALTLGPVAVAGVSAPPVPVAAPASSQATAAPVPDGDLPLWLRAAAERHAVPLAQLTAPREALRLTLSPIEREIDDLLAECKRRHLPYHGSRLAVRDADYRDRLLAHLGRPPEGWGEILPDDAPRQVEAAPPPAPAPDTLAARLAAAARAAGGSLSYAAQQAVADEYKTERLRERLSEGSPEDRRWQAVKANQAQRQATPTPAPRPRGSLPALDPGGPSERLRRLRGEGAE